MMKSRYLFFCGVAAGLVFMTGKAAYSQDVNPTVEVSRAYRSGHAAVDKPAMQMAVPDSVLRFDIDVDYTVNASPYRGSYEFRPYMLDIRPDRTVSDAGQFFLRLGAGYSLHPVADVVYTPRFRTSAFSMGIYGTHRSYFGRYRSVGPEIGGMSSGMTLDWDRFLKKKYSGYDTYTGAGICGRADWKTGFFSFDAGYLGHAGRDTLMTRGFDAFRTVLRVASNNPSDRYISYDVSMSYLYGEDKVKTPDPYYLVEHDFSFRSSAGPVFSEHSRALLDVALDLSAYRSYLSSVSGRFSLTPRYVLDRGRWLLDLGVELSVLFGNDMTAYCIPSVPGASGAMRSTVKQMHQSKGQFVYPDIEIGFDAIRNYLNIYVRADGGEDINRYSDMLSRNRFTSILFTHNYAGMPLLDNTVERINARLGFKGNIGSRFMYDLYGGYARYHNKLLDAVVLNPFAGMVETLPVTGMPVSLSPQLLPAVAYGACNWFYADFRVGWHSQDVTVDGVFSYRQTDLGKTGTPGFAPAPFSADVDVVYNWKKRIFVGLHCDAALARDGYAVSLDAAASSPVPLRLPGYADLGISTEYRFNRKASFWLYGGNLLDMAIQRTPLYCESGIYFTAGITFSL